jgi:hypothetical protein
MHRVKPLLLFTVTFLISLPLLSDIEKGNPRKGAESSPAVVTEKVKVL